MLVGQGGCAGTALRGRRRRRTRERLQRSLSDSYSRLGMRRDDEPIAGPPSQLYKLSQTQDFLRIVWAYLPRCGVACVRSILSWAPMTLGNGQHWWVTNLQNGMLDASGSGLERPLESTHQAAVGRFRPVSPWRQSSRSPFWTACADLYPPITLAVAARCARPTTRARQWHGDAGEAENQPRLAAAGIQASIPADSRSRSRATTSAQATAVAVPTAPDSALRRAARRSASTSESCSRSATDRRSARPFCRVRPASVRTTARRIPPTARPCGSSRASRASNAANCACHARHRVHWSTCNRTMRARSVPAPIVQVHQVVLVVGARADQGSVDHAALTSSGRASSIKRLRARCNRFLTVPRGMPSSTATAS